MSIGTFPPLLVLLLTAALPLPAARIAPEPTSAPDPERRALLVAIEDYKEAQGWPRLRGPRRDAAAMFEALLHHGFERENLHVLLDEEATRAGILAAFDAMIERSKRDDVLLFYFAGHGSRVRDHDGDELDGFDETLVPFDSTLPDGSANDILDDDLSEMIARANEHTDHMVFVFDCCSSGTNVRGNEEAVPRYVAPQARGLAGVREGVGAKKPDDAQSGYSEGSGSYVALSACRAAESAFEVRIPGEDGKPRYQGLFTHHLVDELRGGGALSYEMLLRNVRDRIRGLRRDQTPQVDGPLTARALFGSGEPGGATAFAIELSDSGPVLRAGRTNGLEPGSELEVYRDPAAAAARSEPCGRIRLVEVGPVAASLTWLGSTPYPDDVERLWAVHGSARSRQLDVAVLAPGAPPFADELARELEQIGLFRRVSEDAAKYVVQLESGPEPTWSVRAPDGTSLPFRASASQGDEVDELVRALTVLARAHLVERTVQRETGPRLEVETAIERIGENGRPTGPVEAGEAGLPALAPGERFGCRLTNRSPVPIYATLLVFSPDGEIGIVQRPQNEDDSIPPGATLRSPVIHLVLNPGSEPFYRAGNERFRWVVTTDFHDLRNLRQPSSTRPATRGTTVTRSSEAAEALEHQTWLTVTSEVRMVLGD